MPLKLGPAGVPLSCKGRTIVEGMDDITVLGLDAMEVQTVRTIQPQHFDQYWQAGILSWKSDLEMNMHGPYYAELLGSRRERNRTLSKMETSLQAGKIINARHLTFHVGPYGELGPGREANEQVANVMAGVVERVHEVWNVAEEEEDYAAFPWVHEAEPSLVGIETSGRQEIWGTGLQSCRWDRSGPQHGPHPRPRSWQAENERRLRRVVRSGQRDLRWFDFLLPLRRCRAQDGERTPLHSDQEVGPEVRALRRVLSRGG